MAKYIQENFKPPIIVGFGNPLLDIYAKPPPTDIFEKYKLKVDEQIEMQAEEFTSFCKDVATLIKRGLQWPGGSTLNTLRLFQWIVGSPGYTVLFGAIGDDDNGRFLEEYVNKSGVIARFIQHEQLHTGTCLTFVQEDKRTLVAHIGAANFCTVNIDLPELRETLKIAQLIYVEGFFITHDFKTIEKVLKICHENQSFLAFNLSAPYVCENFTREVAYLIENADIIVGNAVEFKSFCTRMNWDVVTSVDSALAIQKYRRNLRQNPSQNSLTKKTAPLLLQNLPLILITDGTRDIVTAEGLINPPQKYPVPRLPKCQIKDSTGAGDAFMAGFLAAVFCGGSMNVSVDWGCKAASRIIQIVGVTTPCSPPAWVEDLS